MKGANIMQFQFGKNPEFTVYFFTDLTHWALPICILWCWPDDCGTGVHSSISVKILCFNFELEVWKWKKE